MPNGRLGDNPITDVLLGEAVYGGELWGDAEEFARTSFAAERESARPEFKRMLLAVRDRLWRELEATE